MKNKYNTRGGDTSDESSEEISSGDEDEDEDEVDRNIFQLKPKNNQPQLPPRQLPPRQSPPRQSPSRKSPPRESLQQSFEIQSNSTSNSTLQVPSSTSFDEIVPLPNSPPFSPLNASPIAQPIAQPIAPPFAQVNSSQSNSPLVFPSSSTSSSSTSSSSTLQPIAAPINKSPIPIEPPFAQVNSPIVLPSSFTPSSFTPSSSASLPINKSPIPIEPPFAQVNSSQSNSPLIFPSSSASSSSASSSSRPSSSASSSSASSSSSSIDVPPFQTPESALPEPEPIENISEVINRDEIKNEICKKKGSKKCTMNATKLEIEKQNKDDLGKMSEDENNYLYPSLDDPNFLIKIAKKKEFNDTKYDGIIADVKKYADEISNIEYGLLPQQAFVRNFLSFQTPYNSLLLFHGLGSGKTCSAIGVCEEMREYLIQMTISKKIIIVASPNVQDNFRLQLFDERKLKQVDGMWTISGCISNKLLKEINVSNSRELSKEIIVKSVKNLINTYYDFYGYTQFANEIGKYIEDDVENASKNHDVIKNLQNKFSDTLIVIDEVHNIRIDKETSNKNITKNLMLLVSVVSGIRLLLLSATPMFNNYSEIIWLLNLMNANDKRAIIHVSDVFNKNGSFKKDKNGNDIGKELLIRKATGYISYVRGENPYTFPFRVYPNVFAPDNTFLTSETYPNYQLNGKKILEENKIKKIFLFLTNIGEYQELGYKYIIDNLRNKKTEQKKGFKGAKSFGYSDLQLPIESLNIVYPHENLEYLVENITSIEYTDEIENVDDVENIEDLDDDVSLDDEMIGGAESSSDAEYSSSSSSSNEVPEFNESPDEVLEFDEVPEYEVPELNQPYSSSSNEVPELNESSNEVSELNESSNEVPELNESSDEVLEFDEGPDEVLEFDGGPQVDEVPELTKASSSNEVPSSNKSLSDEVLDFSLENEPPTSKKNRLTTSMSTKTRPKDIYKIDPRELVGKQGLKRVMNFQNTQKPLFKGNFKYKKGYDKIFSPNEIGKYSAKIQAICDTIYNRQDDVVSDGIILIYSNYIDGGLVPVALALEEMGFTRYGSQNNSLFETPPTNLVDVRTMKPGTSRDFKPAKYTMITGDPKLSKNNDLDMKLITADENIRGENIKVVLISQAGSEGLDFKGLRIVHIIDPWFNINRIEQIIGRAVRNNSHKSFPFEERNVMIYLHGTLLASNPDEEACDLYMYRSTEIKAIKIGKITRILKQISVDCLINHDQSLLTNKNLNTIEANQHITQQLSTGTVIENFKVGDIDNSVTCDFMTCDYKCNPNYDGIINDENISIETYNETFIKSNSDKIISKIKQLMKEKFFYIQEDFIKRINFPKKYPMSQIYSAITQMIEDSTEIILDKYGRSGRLINLGSYYLFQPNEIDYQNISIYERSVPVNFKHDNIHFKIKNKLVHPVIDKRQIFDEDKSENIHEFEETKGEETKVTEYRTQIMTSRAANDTKILKKYYDLFIIRTNVEMNFGDIENEDNLMYNMMFRYITNNNYLVQLDDENERRQIISKLYSHQIFDMLHLEEKIKVMNALELNVSESDMLNSQYLFFLNSLKQHLNSKIINEKGIIGIFFSIGKNKFEDMFYFIKNKNKKWEEATPQDKKIIIESAFYKSLDVKKYVLNEYYGFIGIKNAKTDDYVFKIKETKLKNKKNSKGFVCSQHNKKSLLDNIISKFNVDHDGNLRIDDSNKRKFQPMSLCILTEFIYRYYETITHEDKHWFGSTELATINNFEELEKKTKK